MRLHGVVEVNETGKLNATISAVFKASLNMTCHKMAGKLLTDTVLPSRFDEGMIDYSSKFLAVIEIG